MDVLNGNYLESDPRIFLNNIRPQFFSKLEEELKKLNGLKFQLALKVLLSKVSNEKENIYTYSEPIFRHKQEVLLQVNEIEGSLDIAFPKILEQLKSYMAEGSNWNFDRIQLLWLDIAKYEPLKGGSYSTSFFPCEKKSNYKCKK